MDRALSNSTWAELFPRGRCNYLQFEGSDHRPLVTYLDNVEKKKRGIFRYDRRLRYNLEVKQLITQTWNEEPSGKVEARIKRCRSAISIWSRDQFQNSQKNITSLKQRLEEELIKPEAEETSILEIKSRLNKAYKEEEEFWKQMSRQLWLTLGDKNTGYFHAITKGRKAINKFSVLENDEGIAFYEEEDIEKVITKYYKELFTSIPFNGEETVNKSIQPCISPELNIELTADPTPEEIKAATFSIHPDKAPGPDGFSASFFHSNWDTVGPTIIKEVQGFFTSGILARTINTTYVRLIPKITSPKVVSDYRPIALCNVYYKIIAKILTKRLQPVLNSIISENQSAFIPGRAISDNVLITHEVLHYLKNSKAEKHCSMAVKTDMSKAYDILEWDFIKRVLTRFGFQEKWINWIMQCITTVSYSYLINDNPQGLVIPGRGIRQGDPLSPYVFILCSEVLSGLCRNAQLNGNLSGIKVARNCPRINHLLFADDTMFFCKASKKTCSALKEILHKYEQASCQKINTCKSSISFSAKTPQEMREQAKQILDIPKEGGIGKYLGLPEHFGRKKKDLFIAIVDRIRQKAISWSTRFLSGAGKITMIKAVLSAIPTYAMQCFKLPVSLCKRIQSVLTRFWWDANPEMKKMCWISWNRLAKPKAAGGLGFREIQSFNDALLGKLAWRLLTNPESLLAKLLNGKYCHDKTFLETQCQSTSSHGWRGILVGRDLIKMNLGKAIGDGKSTRI
ncbi:putative mitochondrial protein [Cardamine amara subsp. amara]|uniref:Mitochondrial protein n=1 Tax=Cardamine amara subsp. amara TaxID=228776 RepID=A0ABD1AN87_CARAN